MLWRPRKTQHSCCDEYCTTALHCIAGTVTSCRCCGVAFCSFQCFLPKNRAFAGEDKGHLPRIRYEQQQNRDHDSCNTNHNTQYIPQLEVLFSTITKLLSFTVPGAESSWASVGEVVSVPFGKDGGEFFGNVVGKVVGKGDGNSVGNDVGDSVGKESW